jgi:hypothetical protein
MKILAIRQEGTESTGALLFVDLEIDGRFGKVTVAYELDKKNGLPLGRGWVEGKQLRQVTASPDEKVALKVAFAYFLGCNGNTRPEHFPINVA